MTNRTYLVSIFIVLDDEGLDPDDPILLDKAADVAREKISDGDEVCVEYCSSLDEPDEAPPGWVLVPADQVATDYELDRREEASE